MTAEAATTEPTRKLSPRKRAQRIRVAQYVVLGLAVLAAILLANWQQIVDVFFRPSLIWHALTGGLGHALLNTIIYSAGGFIFGLIVGTLLALMKLSSVGPYRWISTIYIEFFRGLPAILVLIAFSLMPLAFDGLQFPMPPYGTVWIALGIVGSAYMAETIRAGIQAVPRGQREAARSLGMSSGNALRKIVLPQAFRIVLPPLTNELILIVKDSSLIYIVGVTAATLELTQFGRQMANNEANLTPLITAGLCYLVITLPLSLLVRRLERSAGKVN